MKNTQQEKNNSTQTAGFTLIEVLVAMSLFIVILVIASNAFNKVVSQASLFAKSEESNIEGIIGLEVLRHDIGQMGFGLPWGFSKGNPASTGSTPPTTIIDSTISYSEADSSLALGALLNDSPDKVPRALASFAGIGAFSSDYFALKGTTLGSSKASQRWTYIPYHNYSASTGRESRPVSFSSNSPMAGSTPDRVIMVNSNANDLVNKDHRLIVDPNNNGNFHVNFNSTGGINDDYLPTDDLNTYMVYGLGETDPRMPFNRADFFIGVPGGVASADGSTDGSLPPFCAPQTGVLYKATVNQANGRYTYIPLLDCVADMQVVLGWDSENTGAVDVYSSLPQQSSGLPTYVTQSPVYTEPVNLSVATASIKGWLTDPKGLREHLKLVKVYILAQEGKRDSSYTYPADTIAVGDLANNGFKKDFNLSVAQKQYRWKLYRIVVRPKNLVSNQR